MTSHPSHRPVSALRERMIEDMSVRGFQREDAQRLHSERPVVCGFHRPRARCRGGRGSAPLPTPPDAERDAAADHQQRGLRLADTASAGEGSSASMRASHASVSSTGDS